MMERSHSASYATKAAIVGDCRYEKADAKRNDDSGEDLGQQFDVV
jgi:hypothetical protein